ncbi:hypothetical protein IKF94_02560 [Candidatus Saccharibacteria bacterium]|nr:hypothetical protein [Candidatus Saccharibacteria bacterium]
MFMVDLISWWYSRGWGVYLADYKRRLRDLLDMFSMGELIRTLFKPYKQISAGDTGSMISNAVDKLISRLVGFFARVAIMIAGCVALVLEAVLGMAIAVIWPVVPMVPIVGIILAVAGVVL